MAADLWEGAAAAQPAANGRRSIQEGAHVHTFAVAMVAALSPALCLELMWSVDHHLSLGRSRFHGHLLEGSWLGQPAKHSEQHAPLLVHPGGGGLYQGVWGAGGVGGGSIPRCVGGRGVVGGLYQGVWGVYTKVCGGQGVVGGLYQGVWGGGGGGQGAGGGSIPRCVGRGWWGVYTKVWAYTKVCGGQGAGGGSIPRCGQGGGGVLYQGVWGAGGGGGSIPRCVGGRGWWGVNTKVCGEGVVGGRGLVGGLYQGVWGGGGGGSIPRCGPIPRCVGGRGLVGGLYQGVGRGWWGSIPRCVGGRGLVGGLYQGVWGGGGGWGIVAHYFSLLASHTCIIIVTCMSCVEASKGGTNVPQG